MSNKPKIARPKEKLKTANGFVVTFNKWITVREFDEITAIFTKGNFSASVDAKNERADFKSEETAALAEAAELSRKKTVELTVVSIEGPEGGKIEEDLYEMILEMPTEDGSQIFEAIEFITNPKKKATSKSPFLDTQPTDESKESSSE